MLEERTPAIVLRGRPHGESDKIVTFLTKDWGKVTGIAKGAKRSQRRFVNVLEPFTHVHLRFRPSRSDELAFVFGCELIQSFRGPSRDLQRFALASYISELLDVMVTGREAGQETYALLLASLQVLEDAANLSPAFLPTLELQVLAHTGYAPHLIDCQQCGRDPRAEELTWVFSPSVGGLLCAHCRDHGGATLLLSPDTVQFLSTTRQAGESTPLNIFATPRVYKELRAMAGGMLSRHLQRPLKSRVFLEQAQLFAEDSVDATQGE
jgi:DNA repair protein RecO (recombination protein O)